MFEKQEVGCRGQTDASQRSLCHGEVRLVPQTDVRHLPGDNLLDFTKEPLALGDVGGDGRLVQQPVYACVRKIAAIESQRWRLAGGEKAAEDGGVGRPGG